MQCIFDEANLFRMPLLNLTFLKLIRSIHSTLRTLIAFYVNETTTHINTPCLSYTFLSRSLSLLILIRSPHFSIASTLRDSMCQNGIIIIRSGGEREWNV